MQLSTVLAERVDAALRLTLITAGTGLALVQLLRLAGASWMAGPSEWGSADPIEALTYLCWVGAIVASLWLLAGIVIAVAARLSGIRALRTLADRTAVPAVRRLAERATAASIVVSTLVAPAAAIAQDPPAPPIPIVAVVDQPAAVAPEPAPTVAPEPGRVETPAAPAGAPTGEAMPHPRWTPPATHQETAVTTTHTVQPGDHLWSISSTTLRDRMGRMPSDAETAAYWRTVIDHNRATLRSGDPDLIYPGETIALPETG